MIANGIFYIYNPHQRVSELNDNKYALYATLVCVPISIPYFQGEGNIVIGVSVLPFVLPSKSELPSLTRRDTYPLYLI